MFLLPKDFRQVTYISDQDTIGIWFNCLQLGFKVWQKDSFLLHVILFYGAIQYYLDFVTVVFCVDSTFSYVYNRIFASC